MKFDEVPSYEPRYNLNRNCAKHMSRSKCICSFTKFHTLVLEAEPNYMKIVKDAA